MAVRIQWDSTKVFDKTKTKVEKGLLKVAAQMTGDIKRSMRGYGSYSRLDTQEAVKGVRRTKTNRRHYPSPPGSPPAVDYGRLRASISFNWSGSGKTQGDTDSFSAPSGKASGVRDGVGEPASKQDQITVVVGTNVEYGGFLELGTSKIQPRPYLRPILEKYRSQIISLLRGED